jgi:glycosyltransferase involved in cell wall biosynthesis
MRVLWIAPWGRPLARVFCDELVRTRTEVLLVTSGQHYEQWDRPAPYEMLITGSPKQPKSYPGVARAIAAARRFHADVIVAEEFTDPRLLPLLSGAPHATLVHDDAPHDHTEQRKPHHRIVFNRVAEHADLLITFSDFVAEAVRRRWPTAAVTVPLPSDAGEHHVPPFVTAENRRDFVLLGRINPYKNVPAALRAWSEHIASPAYRGDKLVIIGEGNQADLALPPHCEWRRERFQFSDVMPVLAAAKASLVHYSSATQSGVQVISMQCGTPALVSDIGGLPEYLPPGETPVGVTDHAGLVAALARFADPGYAAERGLAGRKHYDARYHPAPAAQALLAELDKLAHRRFTVGGNR